jgi:S-DNA-T family DNA segregation ATPase FtsK/SpoIIIE
MPPTDDQKNTITHIVIKLAQLGHEVTWQEPITTGPLITTFRFLPRNSTKVAQITSCAQDLALTLGVEDVVARRLPGEACIGISVPNKNRTLVLWRDTLTQPEPAAYIPLNFGVDSQGRLFRDDLAMMPHLLIAGSTFGGKTVLLNSIIASLMYWRTPDQIRFVLSDTKSGGGLEFNHYRGAPHLLHDPVTTKYQTWEMMDWIIDHTDLRLRQIARAGCQNIQQYKQLTINDNQRLLAMPYWVFVIDELADIMEGDKRGEAKIANSKLGKIVQKARAAGIHVIAATQRPSVDVIAGVVKNNFPARLTFKLGSDTDSRTVINQGGADHLLSKGDMLYIGPAAPALKRLHSAYASLDDIKQMVNVAALQHGQRMLV